MGFTSCQHQASEPQSPLDLAEPGQFKNPLEVAAWQEPGSWPQFGHDPLHTGRADVDFPSGDLEPAWQFRPTTHVWDYQPGYSVWSPPAAGTVAGRPLVILGSYDRNVYAVDGRTGQKVWEFQPGECVFASPALAMVAGRPLVFVAATNRSIYGLDARTGEQAWVFETMPWSPTAAASVMSSPTVIQDGSEPVLLVGVWNSDRSATGNVQSGELIALRAATGTPRWRKRLGSVPVGSPAVGRFGHDGKKGSGLVVPEAPSGPLRGNDSRPLFDQRELVIFVTTQDGIVHALSLADGAPRWQAVLNEETRSSPSLGTAAGAGQLFVGTRLHSLFGLDLTRGARQWRGQAGYWIDSTPAWFECQGQTTVVAGSYDRNVYAWSAEKGAELWHATTGNFAYSSPACATLTGRPVVFMMSWDQGIYMFDGATGAVLWKARSGPLLWSHAFQGDSLWASPVVARLAGEPTLLFAALDGALYAYQPRVPKPASEPASGPSAQ